MKRIILPLLFLAFLSNGQAWPWDKKPTATPTPKPVVTKVEVAPTGTSLQQAKQLIKELNSELNNAKVENNKLKNNLFNATERIKEAELKTQEVQKQADTLKEWGQQKEKEAFDWLAKYNAAVKRYHFLKNIAAIVAAIAGAMVGMYCMRLVPTVYAAYAFALPIAGAILAFGGVWLFL